MRSSNLIWFFAVSEGIRFCDDEMIMNEDRRNRNFQVV